MLLYIGCGKCGKKQDWNLVNSFSTSGRDLFTWLSTTSVLIKTKILIVLFKIGIVFSTCRGKFLRDKKSCFPAVGKPSKKGVEIG